MRLENNFRLLRLLTRQFSNPRRGTLNTTTESQKDDSSFEEMKECGKMEVEVNKIDGGYTWPI
jgi:hypothetical protein